MSFLDKLFGSTKVISKGVDGIYNGVDKLVYTDEEKADNFRLMMKIYEPFKLAQRFMMMIVCPPYVLAWFITFIVSFFTNVEAQKAMLEGRMGDLVLAIASFYFLGGAAEGTMRGVNWLKGKIKD